MLRHFKFRVCNLIWYRFKTEQKSHAYVDAPYLERMPEFNFFLSGSNE